MSGRCFENVLQEKCIEFCYLPKNNQFCHSDYPHVGTVGIHPPDVCPGGRGELQDSPSDLSCRRLDVSVFRQKEQQNVSQTLLKHNDQQLLDRLPFICSHLEYITDFHSSPDAQTITQENIEYQCVPPAFNKIWQEMSENYFCHFPHDTYCPADTIVSNQHSFHGPPH